MKKKISGPIPGMSLTQKPKNAPWEQPPQINKVDEAIEFHLNRLSDPDIMQKGLFILEAGRATLVDLVQGLMRSATYQGIHSIDVGLIVSPVVHEFIKQTADSVGITYEEGLEDLKGKEEQARLRAQVRARAELRDSGFELPEIDKEDVTEAGQDMGQEATMSEEPQVEPQEDTLAEGDAEPVKKGLMSRGNV